MSELHHECGVAAIYHLPGTAASPLCPENGPEEVSRLLPRMLQDIQNRGQLAAGMTSYSVHRSTILDTMRDIGTVAEVFRLSHRGKSEALMRGMPVRRPSGTYGTRLAARTTAMLSRSNGNIFTSTNGSASASTVSWPTMLSCGLGCCARANIIWRGIPIPKSSCMSWAGSCRLAQPAVILPTSSPTWLDSSTGPTVWRCSMPAGNCW